METQWGWFLNRTYRNVTHSEYANCREMFQRCFFPNSEFPERFPLIGVERTLSIAILKNARWESIELGRWGLHPSGQSQRFYIAACVAVGGYYEDGGSAGAGYCSEYGRRPQAPHAHPHPHTHAHAHPHAPQPPAPHPAQHDQPMPCEYPHSADRLAPPAPVTPADSYLFTCDEALFSNKPSVFENQCGGCYLVLIIFVKSESTFCKCNILQTVTRCLCPTLQCV